MEQLLAQVPLLLLVSSRVAGVTAVSPVFTNKFLLPPVRVVFTFLLAFLLLPAVRAVPGATNGIGLFVACILELLVGLLIGFFNQLLFTSVQMAGALLDLDMGFMLAQVLDPVTGRAEPIIGTLFSGLAMVIYLTLNGHHLLIRALASSYELVAAGGLTTQAAAPLYVVYFFGQMLAIAVQMVLPFIAVMLLSSMALAGISRAVPQLQIFAVGLGIKAVAGLTILALVLPYFLGFLEQLFENGHAELLNVLPMLR